MKRSVLTSRICLELLKSCFYIASFTLFISSKRAKIRLVFLNFYNFTFRLFSFLCHHVLPLFIGFLLFIFLCHHVFYLYLLRFRVLGIFHLFTFLPLFITF